MRRAYSVYEMRMLLERRAEEKSLVPPVMKKLKQLGYMDDARYAREFARSHAQLRRQGKFRITRELRTRGIPDRHIEAALENAFVETDEPSVLRARISRRVKSLATPLDERKRASLYRSLLRAGFSPDAIRSELRRLRSGSADDLDSGAEPEFDPESA
jgi:regulatory protein